MANNALKLDMNQLTHLEHVIHMTQQSDIHKLTYAAGFAFIATVTAKQTGKKHNTHTPYMLGINSVMSFSQIKYVQKTFNLSGIGAREIVVSS